MPTLGWVLFFWMLLGVVAWHQSPPTPRARRLVAFAYAGPLMAYALGFAFVCLDPYWVDNGVTEFIPWPERWGMALWLAIPIGVLLAPLALGALALFETWKAKRDKAFQSPEDPKPSEDAPSA